MKKYEVLFAIGELKRFFSNKDIAFMLSQLISCDKCPFKVSCSSIEIDSCRAYFLNLVKKCKKSTGICCDLTKKINSFSKDLSSKGVK